MDKIIKTYARFYRPENPVTTSLQITSALFLTAGVLASIGFMIYRYWYIALAFLFTWAIVYTIGRVSTVDPTSGLFDYDEN